ncbi:MULTISPECIES: maltokinase N-terminal cap-like domain-containing protein [Kitasatospora]|uniref:maltokinase N-terminal cap-like domain-containing protein n=1 Tax=Kitasatospora TaxID=2063 RepID=UPI000CBB604B|nr:maltokinase [Kitasatospora sp. GP30]MDH6143309.1 maltokinase [Kitasatospora sp. GP30]
MSEISRSQAHAHRDAGTAPRGQGGAGGPHGAGGAGRGVGGQSGHTDRPRGSTSLAVGELVEAALPMIADWLPGQRWYAGKGQAITGLRPVTATPLVTGDPAMLHLLLRVEHGEQSDLYQLLLGLRAEAPADLLPEASLGSLTHGPYDGAALYDAVHDPELTGRLLAHLATADRFGPLAFRRTPGPGLPSDLLGRAGTAEQSNTSVIFGTAFILKLFRRISPGTNPDLELSLALSRAGSTRIPRVAAWFESRMAGSEPATLGLLQRFLPDAEDGWELALDQVARLKGDPSPGNFAVEAHRLGRATAEVHRVLARALPVARLDREQTGRLATGMAERLDVAAAAVPALRRYRPALHAAFQQLTADHLTGLMVQRIHGDLHLGQAMRTPHGWVLLDFEGEPAKSVAERRLPQPALRDVAAMLRSFDYAAAHLLAGAPQPDPQLAHLAASWAARNRTAYCAGYTAAGGTDPAACPELLRALEIDKAVYEVVYEARHRPSWLPIPLTAIHRLATAI